MLLILKNANYNVDVITSNKKNFVRLKSLGASRIYTYNEIFKLYNQPFIKKKYDIVFDNVGGDFFGLFLKILNKNGLYFSIGNIKGNIANINILQFILNKIKVIGINLEDQKKNFKLNIFKKLKKIIKENDTRKFIKIVSLNFANKLMNGSSKKNYKYVIKIN